MADVPWITPADLGSYFDESFFAVSRDTPPAFVAILEELYPVHVSPFLAARTICGFGEATRWVGWMERRAFSEAMEGRRRGVMFRLREAIELTAAIVNRGQSEQKAGTDAVEA